MNDKIGEFLRLVAVFAATIVFFYTLVLPIHVKQLENEISGYESKKAVLEEQAIELATLKKEVFEKTSALTANKSRIALLKRENSFKNKSPYLYGYGEIQTGSTLSRAVETWAKHPQKQTSRYLEIEIDDGYIDSIRYYYDDRHPKSFEYSPEKHFITSVHYFLIDKETTNFLRERFQELNGGPLSSTRNGVQGKPVLSWDLVGRWSSVRSCAGFTEMSYTVFLDDGCG